MTLTTTDRVQGNDRARLYDGLTEEWVPLEGRTGTVQEYVRGIAWVIFDDDAIHDRFGRVPLPPSRLVAAS